ncbi:MAG TPA: MFS transporter [Candidatus Sulfomarinibacteraceae bacterium]|nr:MFS transporter [Candidatus Sulfomarinibacteraceae bacterium]
MLIGGIALGLVLGLLAGGRLEHLASIRLRWVQVIFLGFVIRAGTQFAIEGGNAPVDALRLPLFGIAFGLILLGLWKNREQPGLSLAYTGVLLNAIAITVNQGFMPVWEPAYLVAGFGPDNPLGPLHVVLPGVVTGDFLVRAGPLGDIVPIPFPFIRNVASIGDLFLGGGLAFFLFATTVRTPFELDEASREAIRRRLVSIMPARAANPMASAAIVARGLGGTTIVDRPAPAGALLGPADSIFGPAVPAVPAVPAILERVRRHPYVRLALDGSFSALWLGQLISLLGDRIHQVALAFVVLNATGSPIAVGAVFLVATLPNLLFGPIAGTFVDRWDHREVMIVSDLLRAGVVLLIPIAAVTNLALVYPLVFLVTTISIFFRPAKGAILPRIIPRDDLVAGNSAMWIAETFADIGGYVIAGLFVALLGSQLPLAFWADAATYVASAILIASISIAPIRRATGAAADAAARMVGTAAAAGPGFFGELREGWRFLRGEAVILANTLQATVGQFMLGIFLALTPVYAQQSIDAGTLDASTAYSFIEGAIGAGNLVGGFVIGLLGTRIALGRMIILGYAWTGACIAALALTGNLGVAIGLSFGAGVGNLAFVIPSQTLVQRRTPQELMGRLLGLRFSMVYGSMTLAMGVGGVLGAVFGAAPVLGFFGLVTVGAGLAGLLVPAVRDA